MALINDVVENLRRECDKRGISQAELARLADVHYVTVNRIFNFKMSPTVDLVEKLATAMGLLPEKIFKKPA